MRQKVKEGGKRGISINMLVFILGILICASLLTYIIPAGQFDMNPETKALIPGTYHAVEQTPVNLWNALRNIFTGMTNSAKVMSIVIFMGGALKVIISTGAVEEFLNWAIYKLQKKGIAVIVPLMVILFSVLSAYGGNDSFFAFTVIGVAVAAKMGLDPIAGMAMTYFATSVGFAGALKGRTLVAQGIAEVPLYSGAGWRTVWLFVITGLAVAYALWYCFRVKKNPARSFMDNTDWIVGGPQGDIKKELFNPMSLLVIVITAGSFILNAVMGVLKGWTYPEQVAVLLIASGGDVRTALVNFIFYALFAPACGQMIHRDRGVLCQGLPVHGLCGVYYRSGRGYCADHDPGKYSPHHGQCSGCTAHACEQRLRHHCHVLV